MPRLKLRRRRLSPPARLALLWLTTSAADRPGPITTTAAALAHALGYTPPTIRRALAELRTAGIVTLETNNAGTRARFCTQNGCAPTTTPATVAAILRA
jgi:hypothetical protein